MIEIHDEVYGDVHLDEPVLEALLGTRALCRLQHVAQSGVSALLGIAPDFSRYDHSVGVMLLLRHLGAPLPEQIAGLMHDISHTAFSHVADFVYSDRTISYHEHKWAEVVADSAIPGILAHFGYDWKTMEVDSERFPLLEQPSPRLCADRVDYFLRTVVPSGLGTQEEVAWALDHLTTHGGRMVVTDLDVARWMAETYLQMDETMWTAPREVALYWLLASAMQRAVSLDLLQEEDWYRTDRELWELLHQLDEARVQKLLSYVSAGTVVHTDHPEHDFVAVTKVRTLDPMVSLNGVSRPLSVLDPAFAERRAAHIAGHREPLRIWVTQPEHTPVNKR